MSETWSIIHDGKRPPTTNWSRGRAHWAQDAEVTAEWRFAYYTRARQAKVPKLELIEFEIIPLHADFRSPQDTAACQPAAKAAIDGIICAMDSRPWDADQVDDGPDRVLGVTFRPPARGCGVDGMQVVIRAVVDEVRVRDSAVRHLLVPVLPVTINDLVKTVGKMDFRALGRAAGKLLDEASSAAVVESLPDATAPES